MVSITGIYELLDKAYGPQKWWPTSTANWQEEVIIGAILTQNTSWKNVEKAISNLKKRKLMDFGKIATINTASLAAIIKPSGYYNQKAIKLKTFARHIIKNHNGNVRNFLGKNVNALRRELLSLHGIGPETADSIILYAAVRPVFVIDAYTKRIFSRIGIAKENSTYNELQQLFTKSLKKNTAMFNQYHALIVELGKNICKKKPICNKCPVKAKCSYYRNVFQPRQKHS